MYIDFENTRATPSGGINWLYGFIPGKDLALRLWLGEKITHAAVQILNPNMAPIEHFCSLSYPVAYFPM